MQGGIDTAGDAGKQDRGDREAVKRKLRVHRRIDHADAAQEQDRLVPFERTDHEGRAVHDLLLPARHEGPQRRPLGREG